MALFQTHVLSLILAFALIALASNDIGKLFGRWRLPLITGFLATGVLAGPYCVGLMDTEAVEGLRFIDQISLAVIAIAAGQELFLKELGGQVRSITAAATGQIGATFALGVVALLAMSPFVPFLSTLSWSARLGVALLAGTIMVARSPSSAIAIITELRARGPFTQTVLGTTVIIDVAVIVMFAASLSLAVSLVGDRGFAFLDLGVVLLELLVSLALGAALGWLIAQSLRFFEHQAIHRAGLLALGYATFLATDGIREYSHENMSFVLHFEPLLICMVAGFFVTNYTDAAKELHAVMVAITPAVFVIFFTLTGASLELDVIAQTWPLAVGLFLVRLSGIALGSWVGGTAAGDPPEHIRVAWMAYLTQAGVALGLAKNVAAFFPDWGPQLATTLIAVIVLNQLVGPPFLKWAIFKVGEERIRDESAPFEGVRDALIVGVDGQSLALARKLKKSGWNVKLADADGTSVEEIDDLHVNVYPLGALDLATLEQLGAAKVDAIVCVLSDEENLKICQLAREEYDPRVLVVRVNDPKNSKKFTELGALVVDARLAMLGLLDRAVRSPAMTSIVLGMDEGTDVVDVEVGNEELVGLTLMDLRLPFDVAVLYIQHEGKPIPCSGKTVIGLGDRLTLSGPHDAVENAVTKLE